MRHAQACIAALLVSALAACASPRATQSPSAVDYPIATKAPDTAESPLVVNDPLEPFNRLVYRMNAELDRYVMVPAVRLYEGFIPPALRAGTANFFDHIGEIDNLVNTTLQGKLDAAGITLARIAINTTLGVGGLLDPASTLGLPRASEDFGQTLGVYGVGAGPYLMLPFFGPANLRDTIGLSASFAVQGAIDPLNFDQNPELRAFYFPLFVLDTRHGIDFRYFQTGSPFEYSLIRMLYTESRRLEIAR